MSHYPKIPVPVFFILPTQIKTQLRNIKKRKVSAISTQSASSTVRQFLNAKVCQLELDIDYASHYRAGLKKAYESKILSGADWDRIRTEIETHDSEVKKEFVTLNRQRKIIEDDLEEIKNVYTIQHAYAKIMVNRISISRRSDHNLKKNPEEKLFRFQLIRYYQVQEIEQGQKWCYCVATGRWWQSKDVKATHIVPKSLESEELAYMFGAGELNLSEPRNGIYSIYLSIYLSIYIFYPSLLLFIGRSEEAKRLTIEKNQ